jgi:hypothetical protein
MSWIDKVKNGLIIRTGDGTEFNVVLWKNASRSQEYNIAQFEFPEIDGTLVKRSRPKGMQYNLEFYFQGEFHLDDVEDFRRAADDNRNWTLLHPFYGSIVVAPVSINYDNTTLNYTKITASVLETITEDRPKTSYDPKDKISFDKQVLDTTLSEAFATDVIPNTSDIASLSSNNTAVYNLGKKKVKLTLDAEEYFNAFNTANSKITEATNDPLDAIMSLQAVINAPALFADTVQNRITLLVSQFDTLRLSIENIGTASQKRIFENNIAALISAMLLGSSRPQDGDYKSRSDVLAVITQLLNSYNTFISDIDGLQTENGGDPDSYIPDHGSMFALSDLVDYTISNLFNIAIDGKQERTIILSEDSNAIVLTHRFYGIDADDAMIDQFINQNNIGLNELLNIRKGRTLIYYI